jgi:hypothetical protein
MTKEEIWSDIPGFEGLYKVSNISLFNHNKTMDKELISGAMDQQARNIACEFVIWMEENAVRCGSDQWVCKNDKWLHSRARTTKEMYNKFIEEQLQISNNNTLIP